VSFHVDSEVGVLKQVVVHRPGLELERLTPENCFELLFDDVMWSETAKEEHDAFVAKLEMKGVKVHRFAELLGEALDIPEARQWLYDRIATPEKVGYQLMGPLHDRMFAPELSGRELAEFMIGGILKSDLSVPGHTNLWWDYLDDQDFVLTPLPNHLFQRDNTAFAYNGLSVHPMAKEARRREVYNSRAVWNFHPMFEGKLKFWYGNDDVDHQPATVEGGDVLVVGNKTIMIGMGERSSPQGIGMLVHGYFSDPENLVEKVIVVELPKSHAFMHLDTAMTMIDKDKFCVYPYFPEQLRTYTLTKASDGGDYTIKENKELFGALAEALDLEKVHALKTPIDERGAQREQWNDGTNFLAIAPGVIYGYERNTTTNTFLRQNGIEIVSVAGEELGRGRGGPRCMSCPIEREAVEY
jgi:arginine deiminase